MHANLTNRACSRPFRYFRHSRCHNAVICCPLPLTRKMLPAYSSTSSALRPFTTSGSFTIAAVPVPFANHWRLCSAEYIIIVLPPIMIRLKHYLHCNLFSKWKLPGCILKSSFVLASHALPSKSHAMYIFFHWISQRSALSRLAVSSAIPDALLCFLWCVSYLFRTARYPRHMPRLQNTFCVAPCTASVG
jgi:hypothetical protein